MHCRILNEVDWHEIFLAGVIGIERVGKELLKRVHLFEELLHPLITNELVNECLLRRGLQVHHESHLILDEEAEAVNLVIDGLIDFHSR